MALALTKAARLKPEIRLAQALSEFEAILADEQKAKLRGYRQEAPPTAADVMRFTAEIDRGARRSRRCVGPRLYNFLQAVQMFAGVVDIVVGGAQSLVASATWGVVKLSLQLTSTIPSYFEQLSTLFMSIGRTCPRNQEYLLLFPRSDELREAVCEYFIVSVQLCKQAVLVLKRPFLGQLLSAMGNTIMSDLSGFEAKLVRLASAVAEEINLASRRLQVQEAERNSMLQLISLRSSSESKKWRSEEMERRFLEACSAYDYQTAWKQVRKQGRVEWFLKEQTYTDWTTQTVSSVLHCNGTLGSGKSVLTANIVDELASRDPALSVVYFFCRYDDLQSLSPRTVIGSIAAQILSHLKPDMSKIISRLQFNTMGSDEVFDTLQTILSTSASKTHKLCIVLDGVDECKETDAKIVLNYLNRLIESSIHVCHVFFSSRPDVSHWTSKSLPPNFTFSMSASRCYDEMTPYIDDALEVCLETGRLSVGNLDIITKIRDTLVSNAHGMYLWVVLQINNICSQPTDKAILNALENIPRDLSGTFNRILQNLRDKDEYAPLTAYSVMLFRIVAAARRPLTLAELREAVSVEQGEIAWDPDQLVNDMQKLIYGCGSLVVVDEEDFTVRFIHRSVRQFLCSRLVDECVKEYKMDLESANLDLGNICVTYLNSERHISQLVKQKPQFIASSATLIQAIPSASIAGKIATRLLNSKEQITHRMRSSLEAAGALSSSFPAHVQSYNIFLPYAQENWLYHTTQLCRTTHPRIWHLWKRLVTGEVKIARFPWSQEECIKFDPAFVDFVLKGYQWNLLFIFIGHAKSLAAMRNLEPVYDFLKAQADIKEHSLVNSSNIRQLVQILEPYMELDTRLYRNLDDYDQLYAPALHVVAGLGLTECVHFLLTNGAAVNLQGGSKKETALQVACLKDHEAIVKLLLEYGAAVNLQGGSENETALQVACRKGHEAIVKLLLEHGAAVNLQDGRQTALHVACDQGHEAIVKLLLKNGADVNLQGGLYGTGLQAACNNGHRTVVKFLLEHGAKVNLKVEDSYYGTALQAACFEGHESIVKLLLENGAEVNLQGGFYDTALQAACLKGNEAIVKILLENGAQVNLQGGIYGTALVAACRWGRTSTAKHLLENGADLNLEGRELRRGEESSSYDITALEAAKKHGKDDIVKLLLEHGAKRKRFLGF